MSSLTKRTKIIAYASTTVFLMLASVVVGATFFPARDSSIKGNPNQFYVYHVGEQVNNTGMYFAGIRFIPEDPVTPWFQKGMAYAYFINDTTTTLPKEYDPALERFMMLFLDPRYDSTLMINSPTKSNDTAPFYDLYKSHAWDYNTQTIGLSYEGGFFMYPRRPHPPITLPSPTPVS
jgi:hypothetical protein